MNPKSLAVADAIQRLCQQMKVDMEKAVWRGNKSAARRSRKASTTLAKLMKEWRKASIQEIG